MKEEGRVDEGNPLYLEWMLGIVCIMFILTLVKHEKYRQRILEYIHSNTSNKLEVIKKFKKTRTGGKNCLKSIYRSKTNLFIAKIKLYIYKVIMDDHICIC